MSRPCGVVVLPSSVVEMNLSALADGQILSYLVETRPRYSNDHDEKNRKRSKTDLNADSNDHFHIPMPNVG